MTLDAVSIESPVESLNLGWFTIDRFDRERRSCIIRGTGLKVTPPTFTVLKTLSNPAHGTGLVPYATLRAALGDTKHAGFLVSKALNEYRDLIARAFVTKPEQDAIESHMRQGVRLLAPYGVLPPLLAVQPKTAKIAKPRTQKQKALAPVPTLSGAPVAPGQMEMNALYLTGDGRWVVPAGRKAIVVDEDEDGEAITEIQHASVRLDGEDHGVQPLDATSATRIDGAYAYAALRAAHRTMENIIAADEPASMHFGQHAVHLAKRVNSGNPAIIATALAETTLALRRNRDTISDTTYGILHRRALGQMARFNAMAFDIPLDEARRTLTRVLSVHDPKIPVPLKKLFPYKAAQAVTSPGYAQARHGTETPPVIEKFGWFSVVTIPGALLSPYKIVETGENLRGDAYRLLKYMHEHQGGFIKRKKILKSLYSSNQNPEAAMGVALTTLRKATESALPKDRSAKSVFLSERAFGLRLLGPKEHWSRPVKVKVKKERALREKPLKPEPERVIHDFGFFNVEETVGVKRQAFKFTDRYRFLTDVEFSLLEHLHKNAGQWLTRADIAGLFFDGKKNPLVRAGLLVQNFARTLAEAIGPEKFAQSLLCVPHAGICLATPEAAFPAIPEKPTRVLADTFARAVQTQPGRNKTMGHFKVMVRKNAAHMRAYFPGTRVTLSPGEYETLCYLAKNPGQWLTRKDVGDAVFAKKEHPEKAADIALRALSKNLIEALGEEKAALSFKTVRGVGVSFATPDTPFPPVPEKEKDAPLGDAFARAIAENPGTPEDFGAFTLNVRENAKRNYAYFPDTQIRLSHSECSLLRHLHAHKGQWVSMKDLRAQFFAGDKYAASRIYTLSTTLMAKVHAALGERGPQVLAMAPMAGMALADRDQPLPARPVPAMVRAVTRAARAPEADIYYHPAYGPGYDLGPTTREIMGSEATFQRFMPLTAKDAAERNEVLLSENQVKKGYGKLDMDAYRTALEAGAHALRVTIQSRRYDGPPPPVVQKAFSGNQSPSNLIPLLAAFSFYVPQHKDGAAQQHAQLQKTIARCIQLAYPHITQQQALAHLHTLQTSKAMMPRELVWPFETPERFASATAALAAATRKKGPQAVILGGFSGSFEGAKTISGGGTPAYDVAAYLERLRSKGPASLVI